MQPALHEEAAGAKQQQQSAGDLREGRDAESRRVARILDQHAAHEDTQPHAEVPRREDRRVGRAPLVVARHGDEHVQEGRIHAAVAQSDEQRREVVGPLALRQHEERVAHGADGRALQGVLRQMPLAQGLRPVEPRHEQTDGEQREKEARAVGDPEHLLAVDGHIVAHHAPAEAEEQDIGRQQPRPRQKKVVHAQAGLALDGTPCGQAYGGRADESDAGHDQ